MSASYEMFNNDYKEFLKHSINEANEEFDNSDDPYSIYETENNKVNDVLNDLHIIEKKIDKNHSDMKFTKTDELHNKIIESIETYREIIELYSEEKKDYLENFKSTILSIINDFNNVNKINELEPPEKKIFEFEKNINYLDMYNKDESEEHIKIYFESLLILCDKELDIKYNSYIGNKNISKIIELINSNLDTETISVIKKYYTNKKLSDLNLSENIKTYYSLVIDKLNKKDNFDNELFLHALKCLNSMINNYNKLVIIENNKEFIEFNLRTGKEDFVVHQDNKDIISKGNYISHGKNIFNKLDNLWFELFNIKKIMNDAEEIMTIRFILHNKLKEINNVINKLSKYYIMEFQHYKNENIKPIDKELRKIISLENVK